MTKTKLPNEIARIVANYDRGSYSSVEAAAEIIDRINPTNAATIFSNLPHDLKERVKSSVKSAPITDEEWDNSVFINIQPGNPCSQSPDKDFDEQSEREYKINHRHRIEALRNIIDQF